MKAFVIIAVLATVSVISACGGSGGGNNDSSSTTGGATGSTTGSSTGGATGSGGTGGTTGSTVPPNTVDLTFEDYHLHGGVYSHAVTFHFRIANHNTAGVTVPNIPWVVNDQNGTTIFSGTIPSLTANSGVDILESYSVPPGMQSYFILIDPANTIPETSKSNNTAEVVANTPDTFPTVTPQANELTWFDPHMHHPNPYGLAFHVTVENVGTSNTTLSNVPWQIVREDNVVIASGVIASLPPGQDAATQVETVVSHDQPVGEHTYTWQIDPTHTIPDNDPTDDTVQLIAVMQPAGGA